MPNRWCASGATALRSLPARPSALGSTWNRPIAASGGFLTERPISLCGSTPSRSQTCRERVQSLGLSQVRGDETWPSSWLGYFRSTCARATNLELAELLRSACDYVIVCADERWETSAHAEAALDHVIRVEQVVGLVQRTDAGCYRCRGFRVSRTTNDNSAGGVFHHDHSSSQGA